MKSKEGKELEEELDKAFEEMGVRPRIFHFREGIPFAAITVATENANWSWKDMIGIIRECGRNSYDHYLYLHATHLMHELAIQNVYGVAICDKRDQFSRQEGRNWAKRRLLRHLKKVRGNKNG